MRFQEKIEAFCRRIIMGKPANILDELPVSTGSLKCRMCGSTTWSKSHTDPTQHFLKADVIECSDCVNPWIAVEGEPR